MCGWGCLYWGKCFKNASDTVFKHCVFIISEPETIRQGGGVGGWGRTYVVQHKVKVKNQIPEHGRLDGDSGFVTC